MREINEEYFGILKVACDHLAKGAKFAMFVADMLGDKKFTVETPCGYHIEVTRREDDAKEDNEVGDKIVSNRLDDTSGNMAGQEGIC